MILLTSLQINCSHSIVLNTTCSNLQVINISKQECELKFIIPQDASNQQLCQQILLQSSENTAIKQQILSPNNIKNTTINIYFRVANASVLQNLQTLNLLNFEKPTNINIDNITVNYVLTDLIEQQTDITILRNCPSNQASQLLYQQYHEQKDQQLKCDVEINNQNINSQGYIFEIQQDLNNSNICFNLTNFNNSQFSLFKNVQETKHFFNIQFNGLISQQKAQFSLLQKQSYSEISINNCFVELNIIKLFEFKGLIGVANNVLQIKNTLLNVTAQNIEIFSGFVQKSNDNLVFDTIFGLLNIEKCKFQAAFLVMLSKNHVFVQKATFSVQQLKAEQYALVLFSRYLHLHNSQVAIEKSFGSGAVVQYQVGQIFQKSTAIIRDSIFVFEQLDNQVQNIGIVYKVSRGSTLELENIRGKGVVVKIYGDVGVFTNNIELE